MRARGLAIAWAALEQDCIEWADGSPRLRVLDDPDLLRILHEDQQTIRAIWRRAATFARRLAVPSTDPFLRYRDPRWCAGGCPSCGARIGEHELRCDLCALAAEMALRAGGPMELRP